MLCGVQLIFKESFRSYLFWFAQARSTIEFFCENECLQSSLFDESLDEDVFSYRAIFLIKLIDKKQHFIIQISKSVIQ